jgi:predicted nucleic acid-binding Zn ribbon protein
LKVFGYGEDALTFWAVTKKLDEVLRQLNDYSDPKECIVFYRPSFGRRGGEKRSEFGEFDAIIITPQTVYLVESKWDGGKTSFPNNILKLDDVQIRRHEIFRWYYENWKGEDWAEFTQKHHHAIRGKRIPSGESLLSQNLKTVLEEARRRKLVDILLFLHKNEPPKIQTTFQVVKIKYKPTKGEYIEMT